MSIPISESFIHHQIAAGKRLIDQHSVIFFDVFDTLITRDCAEPADVFSLMERFYNAEYPESPLQGVRNLRTQAERTCAETIVAPTLDEIYQCLPLEEATRERLKALELETERVLSTRMHAGFALYQYAKVRGKAVVAVSDMYLPAAVIRELLTAAGYKMDAVIVSCECRAEKYNGELFRYALEKIAVGRKNVVHFGDSPVSDVLGSVRAGVAVCWLPVKKHLRYFKPCGDAFSDAYLLPFVANRVSLLENRATALGYEVFGPMLVGFCQWLHEKLHSGGYHRALFCARDMLLTYQIYLRLYPEDRQLVRYFYVSRDSLRAPYHAAVEENGDNNAVQQLELFRLYLAQLGCTGKVALVDSGINGTSQKMLSAISDRMFELHGFYLRLSAEFRKNVSDEESCAFLYPEVPNIRYFISALFFETLIAATHGRTLYYQRNASGAVEPVLGEDNKEPEQVDAIQAGINDFAEAFQAGWLGNRRIPEKAVRDGFLRLAFYPENRDVATLMSLSGGDSFFSPIVIQREKWHYLRFPKDFPTDLKETYWKGGFLCHCFSVIYPPICKIYLVADCVLLRRRGPWRGSLEK